MQRDCLSTKDLIVEMEFESWIGLTAAAEAYKACCNSFGSIGSNIEGRRPRACKDIRRSKMMIDERMMEEERTYRY